MKLLVGCLLLITCVTIAVANVSPLNDPQFVDFIVTYKKEYKPEEIFSRYGIFQQNLKVIEEHNSKDSTYKLGITEFADMTNKEYIESKLSATQMDRVSSGGLEVATGPRVQAPPASLDWRTHKNPTVVGPVRTAGQCQSDAVFSIVDAISGEYSVKSGEDFYSFDPAYVYQCDGETGCSGSNLNLIWSFITKYGLNWYYNGCPTGPGLGLCIVSKNCTQSGSETALLSAVASVGPFSIGIDASHASFQLYKSGIYYEPACSSTTLNHNLLLVGYGSSNGQDYWIARNSWGTSWGQNGDVFLARNRNNNCGVATSACGANNVHTCVCDLLKGDC